MKSTSYRINGRYPRDILVQERKPREFRQRSVRLSMVSAPKRRKQKGINKKKSEQKKREFIRIQQKKLKQRRLNQNQSKQRKPDKRRIQQIKNRSGTPIQYNDPIYKPVGGNLTTEDFKCIFCFELPNLSDGRGIIICPNCHYPAHFDEFKQWTRKSRICSRCESTLPPKYHRTAKIISVSNYIKIMKTFCKGKIHSSPSPRGYQISNSKTRRKSIKNSLNARSRVISHSNLPKNLTTSSQNIYYNSLPEKTLSRASEGLKLSSQEKYDTPIPIESHSNIQNKSRISSQDKQDTFPPVNSYSQASKQLRKSSQDRIETPSSRKFNSPALKQSRTPSQEKYDTSIPKESPSNIQNQSKASSQDKQDASPPVKSYSQASKQSRKSIQTIYKTSPLNEFHSPTPKQLKSSSQEKLDTPTPVESHSIIQNQSRKTSQNKYKTPHPSLPQKKYNEDFDNRLKSFPKMEHEERHIVEVRCPTCEKCKTIKIPNSIMESSQDIIKFPIHSDLICEHYFIINIDKKFEIQGYEEEFRENTIPKTKINDEASNTNISTKAILTIASHALKFANTNMPQKDWVEVIGLLSGKIENDILLIEDAYPMGHGNAIHAEIKDYDNYVKAWKDIRDSNTYIVGWYHSHPSYSPFISEEDYTTQARYQTLSDRAVALVIDPFEIDGNRLGFEIFQADLETGEWSNLPFEVKGNIDVSTLSEILNFIEPVIEGKELFSEYDVEIKKKKKKKKKSKVKYT